MVSARRFSRHDPVRYRCRQRAVPMRQQASLFNNMLQTVELPADGNKMVPVATSPGSPAHQRRRPAVLPRASRCWDLPVYVDDRRSTANVVPVPKDAASGRGDFTL